MTTRDEMRAKFPEVSAFVDRLRAAGFTIGKKFYAKEGKHEAGLNEMRDAWGEAIPVATVLEWARTEERVRPRWLPVGEKRKARQEAPREAGRQAALICAEEPATEEAADE